MVDLRGAVLLCTGPIAVMMPSYIPLMFPAIAADWMVSLSSVQYSLAQRLAVCWALLLQPGESADFSRLVTACTLLGRRAWLLWRRSSRQTLPRTRSRVTSRSSSHRWPRRCGLSVMQGRPLVCGRISGLWGTQFVLESLSKLLHKVWRAHLAEINSRVPCFRQRYKATNIKAST